MYDNSRPNHITVTRLKREQGWTEDLINHHLGAADLLKPNPHRADGPRMRLYRIDRVRQAVQRDPYLGRQLAENRRRIDAQAQDRSPPPDHD